MGPIDLGAQSHWGKARLVSSDDSRVGVDDLQRLIVETTVDELRQWERDPFQHDVGAATLRNTAFGHIRIPLVYDREVLWGGALVEAERVEPHDDGRIRVLDLHAAGWSRQRAEAAAIGEMTADRTATVDDRLLAETLIDLREFDLDLTDAAGWDGDSIDDLIAQIEADDSDLDLGGFGGGGTTCPNCGYVIDE
jgi:hypothetical protein